MTKNFTYERPDGTVRKLSGYKAPTQRWEGQRFSATRVTAARLPARVDLRAAMTAVENQSETSSCVANAVAGAYEYLVKQHRQDDAYDVSRLFIYFVARAVAAGEDPTSEPELEDEGTMIGAAIEGLREFGACSEESWPFDDELVNETPSEEAFDEASYFLVEDVMQVPTRLEAWKAALAEGHPIIFGINLYESFDAQRRPGLVPSPSPREAQREDHAGHAMLAVGYSDRDQVFIVRNSWGEEWGDRGYCYIPYAYLMNPRFNDGDSWVIRRVEEPELDESTWADDDESLIGDVENELAAMSDEDFAAMWDAMGDVAFETRLALVLLFAAGADGEIDDQELEGIADVLANVQETLGIRMNPEKVLRRALKRIDRDEDVFEETVALFAEHVPATVLAAIVNAVQEVVEIDTEDEEDVLAYLVEAWQVDAFGEGDEANDEGDDDDDGDHDDDEDADYDDDEDADYDDDEDEDGDYDEDED
ncbi:MAG: C1 family peptidase [Polyangiales bacterium]|nr:C1 family peptidase [Myxococcales bacterium]MCB9656438.1 C1 family peptidase [Sandaracinaceae bacterium]